MRLDIYIYICLALSGFGLFSSCEEVVEPELVSAPPALVVEGFLTDSVGYNYVILSRTIPYNVQDSLLRVSGATVAVTTQDSIEYRFLETGGAGIYLPENRFVPIVGQRYKLAIGMEVKDVIAEAFMPIVPKLDSLSFNEKKDNPVFEDGYYPVLHFQDSAGVANRYMARLYNKGEWVNQLKVDLYSDDGIDGQYLRLELPYPMELGDSVTVELLGLTESAYKHYEGVKLLTEVGSPSQAIPDNPFTNLQGTNLGYFNASGVSTSSRVIR